MPPDARPPLRHIASSAGTIDIVLTHIVATAWQARTSTQISSAIAAGFATRQAGHTTCSTLAPSGTEYQAAIQHYYGGTGTNPGAYVGADPQSGEPVVVLELAVLCPTGDSTAAGSALTDLLAQHQVTQVIIIEAEPVADFGRGLVEVLSTFSATQKHQLTLVAAPAEPFFSCDRKNREQWAQELIDQLGNQPVNAALGTADAGCAAGLGLLVKSCGGIVHNPYDLVAQATRLDLALAEAALLVVAVEVFDYRTLRASAVTTAAAQASALGIPVVVIAGVVDVGRRELAAVGVSGAYALTEEILDSTGNLNVELSLAELTECSASVAKTWCRSAR